MLLGPLQAFPVDDDVRGPVHGRVGEHVGVAVDHLGPRHIRDIADVEAAVGLGRDGGVHEHLQEDVTELLAERALLAAVDRFEKLVRLLQEVRPETGVGLLAVPGHPPGALRRSTTSLSERRDSAAASLMAHRLRSPPRPVRRCTAGARVSRIPVSPPAGVQT